MRQAIMVEPGNIEFRDVPAPSPTADQILLRIKRIGICGSDVHVWHGKHPYTSYPVVQGHEFSAQVEAVGENVTGIEPGMKATARPQIVCGKCRPCMRGDYNICSDLKVQGFQAPGAAQDLFVTTKEKIVPFPESMSYEDGALVEPTAVAVHATGRAGDLAGKNVAVLGAGTIGNLIAQVASARGAKKVLITDISDFRLGIARQCGIRETSNAIKETLADAANRVFDDEGFDLAFEAAGVEETIAQVIPSIQKGGTIVVVAVFGDPPRVDLATAGDHELRLIGTLMYKHEDFEKAVEIIANDSVNTGPLVTKHFPFENYNESYEFIEQHGEMAMKEMIDL
jgi:2-desacetyl-2-hydroxyethyl bacteriochlorophyllide A dehydrogenase